MSQNKLKNMSKFLLKTIYCIMLISTTSMVCAQNTKKGELLDSIAIIVNDTAISQREWLSAYNEAKADVARLPANKRPSPEILKNEVANQLIFQYLESTLAERNNVKISDDEINAAINDIVARNKATLPQLKDYLAHKGVAFDDFRENIKKQMLSARIRDEIIRETKVTQNEIDLFINTSDFKNAMAEAKKQNIKQWHTKHILITTNDSLSDSEALARISRIKTRIQGGESFAEIAKAQSQDPISAAKGGDLGWVALGQITPEFEKAMQSLPLNQLSDPIKTSFGYHLIIVSEVRVGTLDDESIRNMAKEMLLRKKSSQTWQQWRNKILADSYIEKRI